MRKSPTTRTVLLVFAAIAVAAAALALVRCTGDGSGAAETVAEAVAPSPWDLSTPESAVRSYLDWVTFSYRMANSEIPTATMTPEEGVRVDSYIQLNKQSDRGIAQDLESFKVTGVTQETSAAVLTAQESWSYRYFSLSTLKYLSDPLAASYDSTYTLVADPRGWLVDKVEVTPNGEVK